MNPLASKKPTPMQVQALAGMISPEEVDFLSALAEAASDGVIVEIGSYRGKSAAALALGSARGSRLPVYAVDPHEEFRGVLGGHFGSDDRGAFFQSMLSTGAFHMVRLVNLTSEETASGWTRPVAFLFIDGDHSYEAVQSDIRSWKPHLTANAVVAFDDIDHPELGPRRVAEELITSGEFTLIGQVGKVWALRRRLHQPATSPPTGVTLISSPSVDGLALNRVDRLRWSFNTYVSHRFHLVYVSVAKAACTSMKHVLAFLQDERDVLREGQESWEVERDLIVHERHLWRKTPSLADLAPDDQRRVLDSEDYFRFSLVRNPFTRIFSAWQSKILLQEPSQLQSYRGTPLLVREVTSPQDIFKSFERFLEYIRESEWPDIRNDHWAPQTKLLFRDRISFTRIGKVEEMPSALAALAAHIARFGGELPPMSKRNESLISWDPALVSSRSIDLIRQMYRDDFECFGYAPTPPHARRPLSSESWQTVLAAISMLRSRHERLGELRECLSLARASEATLSAELMRVQRSRAWRALEALANIKRRLLPTRT